jgi:type IV fimbrial biogenesis protein FimT
LPGTSGIRGVRSPRPAPAIRLSIGSRGAGGVREAWDVRAGRGLRGSKGAQGFTLVELMVTVTMIAILSAIAVPSFSEMMIRSAIRSTSSDLGADLNVARSEAIRVGARVSICPRSAPTVVTCGSDWRQGWLVFREAGTTGIGTFGAGDRLVRDHADIHQELTLARTAGTGSITFTPSGALQPDGVSPVARLALRATGQKGRDLEVSVIGRLMTQVEP